MFHIKDSEFIRGNVPMTKDEARVVCISKLELDSNSVLIDVGAGTGSVGIEASRYLSSGKVIGIEVNEEANALIEANLKKFDITNYELYKGYAPQELPTIAFDAMFIGGSKGKLGDIFQYFDDHAKVGARLVINAIVLETFTKTLSLMKEYGFHDIEVVSLNISKNRLLGQYNMMMAENPIFILSAKKGEKNV
ncbi:MULTISPECIES: precorrin-6Y C5,15-methyltransferase (decarboxylating) subunit CbiT [Sulfurospirillum]|uniref:Cobalt-precorrin-6y C(15)-methyltransferase (Decarboxylating) n=4 Tax=Sulfurospirillum TaxID=57665 RepID=A0A1Y0HL21_9BACT|nr:MULTISPECIES: precorrin-6Y C5,15-methyltransferase (decarboxylating) subunit CbiT [Sulfurospirillum]AHJ12818.1 cobalt-precorrin-6y C15-methyltransferase [decarboxylating] CbiT [Sulfurospirillum multivorans DSM 12446]AOO65297.1 cobalt-precorrin-6y C15-methyltransferase [decarboxylating] CbiT [Sulfurospirillum halorespirans DSM 13726]ARU48778.1 Cobalt-precorrin-6y C(15)-methyltransferase (decarboxylating) [Sulfurospirillum diekertiae]ASC93600.1 Cobalt-precorrin-6y C(15)-methyltransferase (deca